MAFLPGWSGRDSKTVCGALWSHAPAGLQWVYWASHEVLGQEMGGALVEWEKRLRGGQKPDVKFKP